MRKTTAFLGIIGALVVICSCGRNEPIPESTLHSIILTVPPKITVSKGEDVSISFMSGKGPEQTDLVVLKYDGKDDTVVPIKSVSNSSFTFALPEDFASGVYVFCLRRNDSVREFKKVEISIFNVRPERGPAIFGTVTCDGVGLPDVVVSDGFTCTKTDADGQYVIISPYPERTRFVFASTPSDYEPVMDSGFPVFFTKLGSYIKDTPREADIVLKKASRSQDEFNVVFSADPQVRPRTSHWAEQVAFSSEDALLDHIAQMKEVGETSSCPCYGIALGDIAFNFPESYDLYRQRIPMIGYPYYAVIGNHDHMHKTASSDDEAAESYEDTFGPRNYSINIGNIHFVCLDDMIFTFEGGDVTLSCGIEDAFLEWLKEDLSYVGKSTPLMLCVHAPIAGISGYLDSVLNLDKLKELLSGRRTVYFWAGHSHHTRCGVYEVDGVTVESHTLARSTGSIGMNDYTSADGVPRGVLVMNVKQGKITWKFHPLSRQTGNIQCTPPSYSFRDWNYSGSEAVMKDGTGKLDFNYQIHAYARGEYGDDFVYANVFMWDDKWELPVLTIDGKNYPFERTGAYDLGYKDLLAHYSSISSKMAKTDWDYAQPMYHTFSVRVPDSASGEGTVSVKDRFGQTHSRKVSVDPIKYTDGRLHLTFALDKPGLGWPTATATNTTVTYNIEGKSYSIKLSKGYYNTTGNYLAIQNKKEYMVLPAVPGYKLTGVLVRMAGNANQQNRTALISANSAGTSVVKGGEELLFCGNCPDWWDLTETQANKEYYLINLTGGFPMGEIRLTYSK